MDGTIEPRTTRSSKRRRISPPAVPSPQPAPARSTSPDELDTDPHTPVLISRRGSTPSASQQLPAPSNNIVDTHRQSFSPVSPGSSPDELDTASEVHTFYRNDEPYRLSSPGATARKSSFRQSPSRELRPPTPTTPEYSRISTPVASLPPERDKIELKQAEYVPYHCKQVLRGHKRGVAAVRISWDGKSVATCSADATIRVWDLTTGECLKILEGHLAGISTLAWSPDSKAIASGSDDKSIWLWNVAAGKPYPRPLLGHHHYIYSVAFSPKGNILVSGSYDEAVMVWDVRSRKVIHTLPAHSDPVGGVDFIRDGTLIVSCGGDGLIRIWDTATAQCLRTLVHEDNAPVTSVRFSPNGKFVLAWTLDACVRLWSYVDGRCVKTYQGHQNSRYSLSGAFGVYGGEDESTERRAYSVSGSEDGRLLWWDVVNKNVLQDVQGHEGVVLGVDTRPDGLLVSCGIDKTVRIWERAGIQTKIEDADDADMADAYEHGVLNGDKPDGGELLSNGMNGSLVNGHGESSIVME